MLILFGRLPYGKCDVVPELFHVVTYFLHIFFIPAIPVGSKLVLYDVGVPELGIDIPLSFKSVAYAWSRIVLLAVATFAWIPVYVVLSFPDTAAALGFWASMIMLLIAMAVTLAFLFLMVYPRITIPTYQRACQLAEYAHLTDRQWAMLNLLYHRTPTDRFGYTVCRKCGYDLHATPWRCPECGTVPLRKMPFDLRVGVSKTD